jgi:hypothetical protein
LPEKTVAYIEAIWGHLMQELGYELSTQGVTPTVESSYVGK